MTKTHFTFCLSIGRKVPARCRQRAFTLTEMAIVLGVFGIILAGVWTAAATVSTNNKTQRAEAQVLSITNGYKSLWAQRGIDVTGAGYVDVTCIGISNHFFPKDMIQPGTVCSGTPPLPNLYPLSPWGGPVVVGIAQSLDLVYIAYMGLSPQACIRVASAIYVPPVVSYQAINDGTANGGTLGNGWSSNAIPPSAPWTLAQITGFCTGGVQGPNTIAQIGFWPQ